jgi:hypothetical protein
MFSWKPATRDLRPLPSLIEPDTSDEQTRTCLKRIRPDFTAVPFFRHHLSKLRRCRAQWRNIVSPKVFLGRQPAEQPHTQPGAENIRKHWTFTHGPQHVACTSPRENTKEHITSQREKRRQKAGGKQECRSQAAGRYSEMRCTSLCRCHKDGTQSEILHRTLWAPSHRLRVQVSEASIRCLLSLPGKKLYAAKTHNQATSSQQLRSKPRPKERHETVDVTLWKWHPSKFKVYVFNWQFYSYSAQKHNSASDSPLSLEKLGTEITVKKLCCFAILSWKSYCDILWLQTVWLRRLSAPCVRGPMWREPNSPCMFIHGNSWHSWHKAQKLVSAVEKSAISLRHVLPCLFPHAQLAANPLQVFSCVDFLSKWLLRFPDTKWVSQWMIEFGTLKKCSMLFHASIKLKIQPQSIIESYWVTSFDSPKCTRTTLFFFSALSGGLE